MSVSKVSLPVWLPWLTTLLSLGGVGVSIYLTITHYTDKVTLACPENAVVNCAKVTSSIYATVFGVPLAVWGLIFFLFLTVLSTPLAWAIQNKVIHATRLAMVTAGVGMVLWLVYIELFRLNAICIYCTTLHIILVLMFILVVFGSALSSGGTPVRGE